MCGEIASGAQRHFPKRPPRLDHLFSSVRPFYFVTFNTYRRLPILTERTLHDAFRNYCFRAQEYDVAVGRYVIMPDHVHLFVAFPITEMELSRWVQMLRNVLGKKLMRLGVQKPHWQEGFFDHVLRSSESYAEKWEYVRLNPVRAGLRSEVGTWPYQGEITRIAFD